LCGGEWVWLLNGSSHLIFFLDARGPPPRAVPSPLSRLGFG
jgi:hypothetical protein